MNSPTKYWLNKILKLSRPRFWPYIAGPYAMGYLIAAPNLQDFLSPLFIASLLFFLIPANVFLYGINDVFDQDTDAFNPKKGTKEYKMVASDSLIVNAVLYISLFAGISLAVVQPKFISTFLFIAFAFLSFAYSAPPFRFKAKPFIDSASNILYAVPGFIAYAQITGSFPPGEIIIAALCWTAAMHLFSAIPDIAPDKEANLKTTAIALGFKNSLLLCSFLWLVSIIPLITTSSLFPLSIAAFVYPLMPFVLWIIALFKGDKKTPIEQIYWY